MDYLDGTQKIALLIFVVVLIIDFIRDFKKDRISIVGTGGHSIIPLVSICAVLLLGLNFYRESSALQTLLLATFILGLLFMHWADYHLGENNDDFWTAQRQRKPRYIVQSGPYKYLRHPIYLGMMLVYASLLFLFFHPLTVALTLVYFGIIIATAIAEERFLRRMFADYDNYAKRTGRFLPKARK